MYNTGDRIDPDATIDTRQPRNNRFERFVPTRATLALAAIGVMLIAGAVLAVLFLPAFMSTIAVASLSAVLGVLAARFAVSRVLDARAKLRASDPLYALTKVQGHKEAWEKLSRFVGVNEEQTLSAQIRVAKLLVDRYPDEFDRRVGHAVFQSDFIHLVRAYRQIHEGTIVAPALRPAVGPRAPRFPGEMQAAAQTKEEAWRTLATLIGSRELKNTYESRDRLVLALVQLFPHGLSPSQVISAAKADVLYEIIEAYARRRYALANAPAQRDVPQVAPAPSIPFTSIVSDRLIARAAPARGATHPNSPKKLNPSAMTKEQAWQAILPIVNLASQPDTERARAVVANRLVSQFPNGLGKYATLAVKASLADLIQSRYAENRADRDASAINRRQPSREI